ncbi:MAG: hypothetical protein JXQ29_07495 [Planctomycetes bacterium]|nr:hypothetical protein [Planctomycetota bacterium]
MRIACCLGLMLVLGGAISAQTVIYGPSTGRGFATGYMGAHTIVRDSQSNLYVIYRYQVGTQWDLAIARSANTGASWSMTWQTGFATPLGTDFGNYHPCIAIDSQDNLHCAWFHRVAFTGSRLPATIHYNRYEAATAKWGTEWVVTPSAVFERPNPVLAVDSKDYVWFSHGNTGWGSVLQRSNQPYAAGGGFTVYSPSPAAQQHCSLVVDKNDYIHITWYEYVGYAGVKHKWIDPAASSPAWTVFSLSNHGATNQTDRAEYYSSLSADFWGNVYAIYTVDDQAGTSARTGPTEFYVRKWDGGAQTWGTPELVHSVPITVWHPSYASSGTDYNSGAVISGACDEGTGEFYFAYRDFATGDFTLGRWRGVDLEPATIYARLMNTSPFPVTTQNYFLYPHLRGTLWPTANRTAWGLDLTYVAGDQTATSPIYTDYFEHFPLASLASTATPRIGTTYPLDLSAVTEGGKIYGTALTASGLMPVFKIGRRYIPLTPDHVFVATVTNQLPGIFVGFQGVLSASGAGQAKIALPAIPGLVGVKIDACFVTYDAAGVRTISNPWGFTITK